MACAFDYIFLEAHQACAFDDIFLEAHQACAFNGIFFLEAHHWNLLNIKP